MFANSCHVMQLVTDNWQLVTHYYTKQKTNCLHVFLEIFIASNSYQILFIHQTNKTISHIAYFYLLNQFCFEKPAQEVENIDSKQLLWIARPEVHVRTQAEAWIVTEPNLFKL